ncbi:hypothetical protein ENSA7_35880 [Enhygromyxa salina]|uniref:Uncharacterized protein n=1 Tax=Enhygromyxa salina TaxID=215803 RepID=A0A2S9YNQ8_9BACT|nr:hypothetical protein ENSA7_35880 [Enhygromyxa salina]
MRSHVVAWAWSSGRSRSRASATSLSWTGRFKSGAYPRNKPNSPLETTFVETDWDGVHCFDFMKDRVDDEFAGRRYRLWDFPRSLRVFYDFNICQHGGVRDDRGGGCIADPPISIGVDHMARAGRTRG